MASARSRRIACSRSVTCRRRLMRVFVGAGQLLRPEIRVAEGHRHRGPGRRSFDHLRGRNPGRHKRPFGSARRDGIHAHAELVHDAGTEQPLQDRPLHFRPVVLARGGERSPLRRRPLLAEPASEHLPRDGHATVDAGRRQFERRRKLDRSANECRAGRGRAQVVADGHPVHERPDFGRLAVAGAELARGCALLVTFGNHRASMLRLRVAVFGAELVCFRADFVRHRVIGESGDLIQSLANFGDPNGELLGGRHWSKPINGRGAIAYINSTSSRHRSRSGSGRRFSKAVLRIWHPRQSVCSPSSAYGSWSGSTCSGTR